MARCRNIKPDFFKNEDLSDLPAEARLLFAALWCWADREGRLEDRPRRLKAEIFPYGDADVDALLDQLATSPGRFIVRYVMDDVAYIEIPGFASHQNPHKAEKESVIPGYVRGKHPTRTVQEPCKDGSRPALTLNPSTLTLNPSTSASCSETDKPSPEPETAEAPDDPVVMPVVMTFPTDGKTKTWDLGQSKVDEYAEAYPSLDVPAECRKALQWIRDNATKRKTAAGMPKFLGNWMSRSQNDSRGNTRGQRKLPTGPGQRHPDDTGGGVGEF